VTTHWLWPPIGGGGVQQLFDQFERVHASSGIRENLGDALQSTLGIVNHFNQRHCPVVVNAP
jgi:hypothetical protein